MNSFLRTKTYKLVIASKRWRDLRAQMIRERGARCERCGKTWAPGYKTTLQLHHKTYEHLGHENGSDVQLVCTVCHETSDRERAIEARIRSADALWDARIEGWARKRYGEDWWYDHQDEEIEDEFEEWLERSN